MRKRSFAPAAVLVAVALVVLGCGEEQQTETAASGAGPAEILSINPANGRKQVPVTSLIVLRVSREISGAEVRGFGFGLREVTGGRAQETAIVQDLLRDRRTVVIRPVEELAAGATYELQGRREVRAGEAVGPQTPQRLARFDTARACRDEPAVLHDLVRPHGLSPYPSDFLCRADPSSPTGIRLAIPEEKVFFNVRPGELNQADGFSPFPRLVVSFSGPVSVQDLEHDPLGTDGPLSPVFLLNVQRDSEGFGERVPFLVSPDPFGSATVLTPSHSLLLSPLKPLRAAATYALVITRRLTSDQGCPVAPSASWLRLLAGHPDPGLDEARAMLAPVLAVVQSGEIELPLLSREIALAVPFTVRSREDFAGPSLAIREYLLGLAPADIPAVKIESVSSDPPKRGIPHEFIATFIKGTVACPDFRKPEGCFDRELIFARPWEAPRIPLKFILTIPRGAGEPNPAGVVVFLHGINNVKEVMYIVADALARAGLAAIAIDAVEHGERQSVPGLPSWIPFLRVEDFAIGRDNLRQTQADLMSLTRAIQGSLLPALGRDILRTGRVGFAGISLGGIIGAGYAALEPSVQGAVLFVTGGNFTEIGLNHEVMLPRGLAFNLLALLLPPLTDSPSEFLYGAVNLMQEILDPGDPMTYAPYIAASLFPEPGHPKDVLVLEAMGDETIANRASEHLARAVGAGQIRPVKSLIPGLEVLTAPVTGNGPRGRSAGICQFDWVTVKGKTIRADHDRLPNSDEAQRVAAHFLATSLGRGAGEILSGYPPSP